MTMMTDLMSDTRKPRIALMGEFSAGKSTLSNLMLGGRPLPERVTATQLPPVWLAFGDKAPFREDLNGKHHPVDLDNLEAVPLEDTLYIKIHMETDILELCDLIDMPGISDPNMPPAVWDRMSGRADGVIWCTHATQAWRQSESAVWETIPSKVQKQSLLLVTRIDKIVGERDRMKLMRRITAETEGLFSSVFPVSLLAAAQAGDDWDAWAASGAEAFTESLIDIIQNIDVSDESLATPLQRTQPLILKMPVADQKPVVAPKKEVFDENAAFEATVDDYIFDDAFEGEDDDFAADGKESAELLKLPEHETEAAKEVDDIAQSAPEHVQTAQENSTPEPEQKTGMVIPRRVKRSSHSDSRPAAYGADAKAPPASLSEFPNLRGVFSEEDPEQSSAYDDRKAAGR